LSRASKTPNSTSLCTPAPSEWQIQKLQINPELVLFSEESMAIQEIATLVLKQLNDHKEHTVPEVVRKTLEEAPAEVYSGDVKSIVLGLAQNKKIEITDDFKVRLVE
jgi:hypothetical protein